MLLEEKIEEHMMDSTDSLDSSFHEDIFMEIGG